MTCYTVPTAAFFIHKFLQRKNPGLRTVRQQQLSQLLLGGALFGIVDHAWHGELFLVGPDILKDLLLGVTITVVIFGVWAVMPLANALKSRFSAKA